jgi:hypothetical protein
MELAEIVELADAVAIHGGIASGMGTMSYAAQIVVDAPTSDEAVDKAIPLFREAAATAGLPDWPVAWAESIPDEEDLFE